MVKNKRYGMKDDVIFKAFFGKRGNEKFLADFLEGLLNIKIDNLEIQEEVTVEKLAKTEKGGRLDLLAKANSNNLVVNIEMQFENEHNIEIRTEFYSSKIVSRETYAGKDYFEFPEVKLINILCYNEFPNLDDGQYIHHTVTVLDDHRDFEIPTNVTHFFIELPKLKHLHPDMAKKINQWCVFLDGENKELIDMAEKNNDIFTSAKEQLKILTGNKELQIAADRRELERFEQIYREKKLRKEGEKIGQERGEKIGQKRGEQIGQKRGEKIGLEKGKIEKSQEIAKNLLMMNLPIEQIVAATGLSQEEIESLKDNL